MAHLVAVQRHQTRSSLLRVCRLGYLLGRRKDANVLRSDLNVQRAGIIAAAVDAEIARVSPVWPGWLLLFLRVGLRRVGLRRVGLWRVGLRRRRRQRGDFGCDRIFVTRLGTSRRRLRHLNLQLQFHRGRTMDAGQRRKRFALENRGPRFYYSNRKKKTKSRANQILAQTLTRRIYRRRCSMPDSDTSSSLVYASVMVPLAGLSSAVIVKDETLVVSQKN